MMQNREVIENCLRHFYFLMFLVLCHDEIQLYNSSNTYAPYFHYLRNIIWKHECSGVISFRFSTLQNSVRKGYSLIQVNRSRYLKSSVLTAVLRGIWISVKMQTCCLMRRAIIPLHGDVSNVTMSIANWHCRSGW